MNTTNLIARAFNNPRGLGWQLPPYTPCPPLATTLVSH